MAQTLNEPLTPRESRVLELLRSGLSNKQIARAIAISEQTVKYHLKNIYGKLGAVGRTHAVALSGDLRTETAPADRIEEERARIEIAQSPLAFARRTRRLHLHREAVVDGDRRFTYEQFFDRCDRASLAWLRLGVARGDRVATIAPSIHSHIEQFYAVPQIGAIIVPIHAGLIAEDYAGLIRHSGACVVCVSREYVDLIEGIRAQLSDVQRFIALDGPARPGWLDYETLLGTSTSDGSVPTIDIDENELISINYTSGTTLQPRGVMLTHRNIWLNTVGVLMHWPMRPEDRYLWLLPLFHGNGWGFVWSVTAAGAAHVCTRDTRTAELCDVTRRERVTMMCAGKTALIGMADIPEARRRQLPQNVRVLTAGASPTAATIERIEQRLGWEVTHAYGLTETSPFIAVRELSPADIDLPLAARARVKRMQGAELLTSGELRVVDEEGVPVPRDGTTLGEIVARGGTVMKGYYREPEASARAFAGGWFHTGDAAVMHADGTIEIRDRFKDIIISGDELISSVEVEDALSRHPAVREAAVVGIPDAQVGESAHAFIVVQEGEQLNAEEARAFAREHLASFKVPIEFTFIDSLPRTPTGKVRKHLLRSGA